MPPNSLPASVCYLVECAGASQDDVGVLNLDDPLSQTHKVRSDTDGSTCHLVNSLCLLGFVLHLTLLHSQLSKILY